ncbi:RidA family protein [Nonomuraea sp. NPDC050680]|uniref:RidA family protein n=1 Tax=Nonomuraea sp. NPDC050680 TaxID=3154630 RepID=UPI003409D710
MTITRLNPDGLHKTPGYSHVTVVEAGRTAFLAGQCPLDATGALVGDGDVNAQVDQIVANALIALAAVNARPEQVVRSVIYVVSQDTTPLGGVWQRLLDSPLAAAFTTASTLLGVARLGFTGQLVELDLTVALGAYSPGTVEA